MKDSTTDFKNFKETVPKEEGRLPIVPSPNLKTLIAEYLKFKFDSLKLKANIPVFTDYPPLVNLFQEIDKNGRVTLQVKRFVSIVQLSSSVRLESVGQVIQSKEVMDAIGLESTHFGWLEKVQLEISYWSINPVDRDRGGELTKLFMFEMHRNGYLLRNGIFSFNFRTGYDTADERIMTNQAVYTRVMQFDFMHFFRGTEHGSEPSAVLVEDINLTPVPTNHQGPDAILSSMGIDAAVDNPVTTTEGSIQDMGADKSFAEDITTGNIDKKDGC